MNKSLLSSLKGLPSEIWEALGLIQLRRAWLCGAHRAKEGEYRQEARLGS